MIGYILTEAQYNQVQGKFISDSIFINCVKDKNDIWFFFASEQDINIFKGSEFNWVLKLPTEEYIPKTIATDSIKTGFNLDISNCNLSSEDLNNFFTYLESTNEDKIITITGNHGASTCNQLIVTTKGYIVIN